MISFDTAMGLTHKLTDAQAHNVLNQVLGRISMEPGCEEMKQHCAEFIEYYVLEKQREERFVKHYLNPKHGNQNPKRS